MSEQVPPAVEGIPYGDAAALEAWLVRNPGKVTPLALERFLGHVGFVPVGVMPTQSPVECAIWRPKEAEENPALAVHRVLVYHNPVVSKANIVLALEVVRRFRAAKARKKK